MIAILWRAQEQHEGWVSEAAIRAVADMLDMPYIRVLEVATFYTMFQLQPVGKKAHVQVCGTTPCRLRGAGDIIEVCQSRIHHDPFHLSEDGDFSLGRGRVPRRLRERADGDDLEGHLRGSDQGELRQGARRLCLRQSAEARSADRARQGLPAPHPARPVELSKDGNFSWEEVECLGACVNAPMVLIWKDTYEDLTKESFGKVLDGFASGNPPKPGPQIDRQFSAPVGGPTTLKETT